MFVPEWIIAFVAVGFVVSNVFTGTVLNFRKSLIHLPKPTPVRD